MAAPFEPEVAAPAALCRSAASRTRERAAAAAAAILLLAALAFRLPAGTYGDGIYLVWSIVREKPFWIHVLYLPVAGSLARALASLGVDPLTRLKLLSAVAAAASLPLLHLAARRLGASALLAGGLALLLLLSTSAWFFARAPELHAPHLAAVAGLAWLLAGLRRESSPARKLAVAAWLSFPLDAASTAAFSEIDARVRAGVPVHLDARLLDAADEEPRVAAVVDGIRARYRLDPVAHGSYRGFRLVADGTGAER